MSHALALIMVAAIWGTIAYLLGDSSRARSRRVRRADSSRARSRRVRRAELRRFPRLNTTPRPIAAVRRDPSPTPRQRQRAS